MTDENWWSNQPIDPDSGDVSTVEAAPSRPVPDRGGATGRSRGRRASRILAVGLAGVAIAAGAYVALGFFSGGGAGSPEDAVTTLTKAIDNQDPALAATVLNPSELPLIVDLLDEVGQAKDRLGGGKGGTEVPGTETTVKGLRLRSEELSPRVSRVTMRAGELELAARRAALPPMLQSLVGSTDEDSDNWSVDVDDVEDAMGVDVSLVVVKEGRGWYVSPTLTAADLFVATDDAGLEEGDFDAFGEVEDFDDGAGTPEEAVDLLADAVSSGDPDELRAALPSDQAQFAVVFGDALDGLLERELASDAGPGRLPENWFQVRSFDVEESDGPMSGTRRLSINEARVSSVTDDPRYVSEAEDYRVSGLEICREGSDGECPVDLESDPTPLARHVSEALGGSASLIAREVDGGWKIDPVATVLDTAARLLRSVDVGLARSATLALDGEPTVTAELGATTELTFDEYGYALVEVATQPDVPHLLEVRGDQLDEMDANWHTVDGPDTVSLSGYDGSRSFVFMPHEATTRVALGGLLNEATDVEVEVHAVPVEDKPFGEEIRGQLNTPLVLHRVPLSGLETDDDGYHSVEYEVTSSGGDLDFGVDDVGLEPGGNVWLNWTDTVAEGDVTSGVVSNDGDVLIVAIRGSTGSGYSYRLRELQMGFPGGGMSTTVDVAGGQTVDLPFDLGDNRSVEVDVSWSEYVDIDSTLSLDGTYEAGDSYTYYGGSHTLYGYGSGDGNVALKNWGSTSARVTVRLDFGN